MGGLSATFGVSMQQNSPAAQLALDSGVRSAIAPHAALVRHWPGAPAHSHAGGAASASERGARSAGAAGAASSGGARRSTAGTGPQPAPEHAAAETNASHSHRRMSS